MIRIHLPTSRCAYDTLRCGFRRAGAAALLLIAAGVSACGPSSEDLYSGELPDRVDFNIHVKPIISDRCFACHGPDEGAREADLRLDTWESASRVIKPGSLRSELVHRILSHDPSEVMPPRDSGLKLSDYEKAILARWIEQGAEYQPHWSLISPRKPDLPAVRDASWPRNPIDRFILARLEREGLRPSPEADRERLIRRVTYDLTGLPPTVEEVDAFLADRSPRAYEKVVDRLLASDAFGERMAVEWLDLARYADSHGYQDDGIRYMWPWRDWVIEAFNRNLPYDEFVTWQLAGDLLPGRTREQILATGFNRNHPQTAEGGVVDEEYRVEYVADRTNTFGRAFLGLTLECARCHDHKYDPISQKQYYELYAFFNNNNEIGTSPIDGNGGPTLLLLTEEEERRWAELRAELRTGEQSLREYAREAKRGARGGASRELGSSLEASVARGLIGYFPLDQLGEKTAPNAANPRVPAKIDPDRRPRIVPGKKGGALEIVDGSTPSIDEGFPFDRADPFTLSVWVYRTRESAFTPILMKEGSPNKNHRGYGLYLEEGRPVGALAHHWPTDALRVMAAEPVPLDRWTHLVLSYDGSSSARELALYVDGRRASVEILADRLQRTTVMPDFPFFIGRKGTSAFEGGKVDEVRIYDRRLSDLEIAHLAGLNPLEPPPGGEWTPAQREALVLRRLSSDPEYVRRSSRLRQTRAEETRLLSGALDVMVMEERAEPRPTFVLERGAYDAPGEPVRPGTPESVLAFPDGLPPTRLGLARWLFAPENPLTARVAVNRYWQMVFGAGLVKTSDDFGNQGELPSHPELLDWLAVSYRESGWNTKDLLRMLVLSSTYRQSSAIRPEHRERDPGNRLLARGPSHRLTAEMIRDGALAASGLLVDSVGGPSVKPYQPEGLWEEKSAGRGALATYERDDGEDLYRRTLYTFWKRSSPPPMQTTFDAAARDICEVRRQSTNTPLQALNLLNDTQYFEAARLLAERMMEEGGSTPRERIRHGFRLVTSRTPDDNEIGPLASLYQEELRDFRSNRAAAMSVISVGEYRRNPRVDPAELAAYTIVANALFNTDESITKR